MTKRKEPPVVPFLPSDAVLLTGNREIADKANYNQTAGPGFTILGEDGKPIASGGIRVYSVGMAWFILNKEAAHLTAVIREAKIKLEEMQRNEKICELYAESDNGDVLLKHLGFKKKDNIWTL